MIKILHKAERFCDLIEVETHNFPTTVEPFNGAATVQEEKSEPELAGWQVLAISRKSLSI